MKLEFLIKVCFSAIFPIIVSGCSSKLDNLPRTINEVKVNILQAEVIKNNSGIPVSSGKENNVIQNISVVPAEGDRTYTLSPPVSSDDVVVGEVAWRSGSVYVHISSKNSPVTLVKNSRNCVDTFLLIFCSRYSEDLNYTTLESSGTEYKIRGWDSTSRHSVAENEYIIFDNVPASSLSNFRLKGIGWSSGQIEVGISAEESAAILELKSQLQKVASHLSFKTFGLLLNRQNKNPHASQILMDELFSYANKTNDTLAYAAVIEQLEDQVITSAPRIKEFAIAYLLAVYTTEVKGSNNTVKIANFLSSDGKNLPHDKFDNIFNDGVSVEKGKIESVLQTLDSVGSLEKMWQNFVVGESIQERKEKFLRSVYSAALEEKRNNRPVRAMMIYKALIESRMTADSHVAFELQRDQEMREFLSDQFEKIRQGQSANTQELMSELRTMSSKLGQVVSNTHMVEESRAEERERNVRMTRDMFFENRYLETSFR